MLRLESLFYSCVDQNMKGAVAYGVVTAKTQEQHKHRKSRVRAVTSSEIEDLPPRGTVTPKDRVLHFLTRRTKVLADPVDCLSSTHFIRAHLFLPVTPKG